jgi:hypothetical protein
MKRILGWENAPRKSIGKWKRDNMIQHILGPLERGSKSFWKKWNSHFLEDFQVATDVYPNPLVYCVYISHYDIESTNLLFHW